MAKGMFGLLERKPLEQVAPVVQAAAASGSLEENYRTADAIWKRNVTQLEKLKEKFEKEKLRCSSVDYSKMADEIAYLENQTAISHRAMAEALTQLEHSQYINGAKWELEQKKQKLESIRESLSVCDTELAELNALEQSIPFRRVGVVGKRQNLWNEFSTIQEDIRRAGNGHS
jgi:hypothetical protein